MGAVNAAGSPRIPAFAARRAGASTVGARHPKHVGGAAVVGPAGEDEEEIGEPIYKTDRLRVELLARRQGGDFALRPARHAARQVQMGRGRGAAGQDEGVQRRKFGVVALDFALQAGHLFGADAQRGIFGILPFRGTEIRTQIEKVVLRPRQDFVELPAAVQAGQADGRVGLLDRADGGDAPVVLGDSGPIPQGGLSLVAAAGEDSRELDQGIVSLYHRALSAARARAEHE